MRSYAGTCKGIFQLQSRASVYFFSYSFCHYILQFLWCTFQTHFAMGNKAFPKSSFQNRIVPFLVIFHFPCSKYKVVEICFQSCRYQNQNFSIVSFSCCSCSTGVTLICFVQHSCCIHVFRISLVLLMLHSCQIRVSGVARVSLMLLLSSTRLVIQIRSSSLFILNRLECGSQYTVWGYQDILPRGVFLGLRVLGHFVLQNQTKKIVKIHKDFVLLQVFVYKFLCQNVIIYINDKQNSKIWV